MGAGGWMAPIEDTFIILPYLFFFIWGTTARQQKNWPFRLISTSLFQSSSVVFSIVPPLAEAMPPALFTRISTLPNSLTVRATISFTSALFETSAPIARDLRPRALTSPATFCAPSICRALTTTSQPSRANLRAIPLPIPLAPPVMIATLFSSNTFYLRIKYLIISSQALRPFLHPFVLLYTKYYKIFYTE